MSSPKTEFQCEICGSKAIREKTDRPVPRCCSRPMSAVLPLDPCHVSTTAEHARFDDPDEPCDDGRSGKV